MEEDLEKEKLNHQNNVDRNQMKNLIIIVIVFAIVWGLVSAIDAFILSGIQGIFPAKTKFQISILQIIIYLFLLAIVIFVFHIDASFMNSNSPGRIIRNF